MTHYVVRTNLHGRKVYLNNDLGAERQGWVYDLRQATLFAENAMAAVALYQAIKHQDSLERRTASIISLDEARTDEWRSV